MTASEKSTHPSLDPPRVWDFAKQELSLQMTRATFSTWLADAVLLDADEEQYVIGVRNEQAAEWVGSRLGSTIRRTLGAIAGRPVVLAVEVASAESVENATHLASGASPAPGPDDRPGPEEELALLQAIQRRRREAAFDDDTVGPGQVGIRRKYKDPADPFVRLPHYGLRFWRPLVGTDVFTLWVTLNSFLDAAEYFGEPWPSIEDLVSSIGKGTRHAILGRNASSGNPARAGSANELSRYRLGSYRMAGKGRGIRYFFTVLHPADLPVLTPRQVAQLPRKLQEHHERWLKHFGLFDIDQWLRDERESAIPAAWWED